MRKRFTSLLLVLVMLMSFFPFSAFAEETEPSGDETVETVSTDDVSGDVEAPEGNTADSSDDGSEASDTDSNGINTDNADGEVNTDSADGESVGEPVSSYTVSITLPDGVETADDSGELTQTVSAGSAMADIRLVSRYEDEPFESDMADAFNARLFVNTGLTACCGDDGVITIGGTPTADVTVSLADAFADEPTTVADKTTVYVATATATESYTTPLGDDTNGDGSEDKPYATISKAYTEVTSGGTIYLLSDLKESNEITFGKNKTVTITSADSSAKKTIYSMRQFGFDNKTIMTVTAGEVIFKNITIDGTGQRQNATAAFPEGIANSPGCIYVSKNGATATLDTGTTIQNFWKNNGGSGGSSVLKATVGGAQINIRDGVLITGCVLEAGNTDDPSSVISSGTGGIVYMTGGKVTGNTLSTSQSASTAIVNIGMISSPHFWMTGGEITGNTINSGAAAVYMRGEANDCDIQFGDTAYVYGNYVSGTSGDQRNIYLKNNKNGTENSNVYVKLCSALTSGAKLGVYAETIGMATKVAQGGGINGETYTATAQDTTYFVSDKATDAEILYCGGDVDTCGLLEHRSGTTHEKAIYLSVSPEVTATKGDDGTITLDIARCTTDATYVVLDKDMKPVTGKEITGGTYNTDGTFKLTSADTTTTISMSELSKDDGPYTVMLVGDGGLTVGSDGKAATSNLTDIATVNIVNFAGEGVTWSDGTNDFENGEFDIVTVPHNDQTGKATKTYTATPKTNYAFAAENAITGKLDNGAETETAATFTATKETDAEKYNVSVTVPAYGTTSKGTTNYNTVTLTGATVLNSGVKLLDEADGEEMTDGKKTYDGVAVAYSAGSVDGATLSYTWQKVTKSTDGSTTYEDLTAAPSDAGEYNLKITATKTVGGTELGTENLPFTISKKALTVTATAEDKTYDGGTDAELKSATLNGLVDGDTSAVTLDTSKITVTFADKNAGDSKAVTATADTDALTGTKAGNYTITSATAANAKISPKPITATITATSKPYDGSANAEVSTPTLTGVVGDDNVTATASDAVFVGGSGVDNNKTVTADIELSGADAGNYKLAKTTATATANITAKELSVTVSAENKAYDGTTTATVTVTLATESGIVGSDTVTLDDSNMKATFENAAVGENKTVTVSGLKLDGDAAKNYKLPASITGTANITKAESGVGTVSLTGWTYGEAGNTPTANSTTNPETETDKITYQYKLKDSESAEWSDTVPTDAGEYTVKATFPANDNYGATTATADFTIAKKTLTATITVKSKEYDGTDSATVENVTLTGLVNGETVTATASDAKFAGVNARNDQTVTATITLSGDKAKNYTVATTATGTASITAKTLTVTATAENKTYDGTTKATVSEVTLDTTGIAAGDTVTLNQSSMTAAFADANVDTDKTVTVSGLTLDNNDNNNYRLPNTITTTANITKATGVGSVKLDGWTYGDTANTPTANSTTNGNTGVTYQYKLKDSESAEWSSTVPTDAGTYTVKATFPENTNYGATTATADFTIAKKTLTATLTVKDKTYDGSNTAEVTEVELDGLVNGETVTATASDAKFAGVNARNDQTVTATITLSGDKAKNYSVATTATGRASITAKTLTVAATAENKTYDGTTTAKVTNVTLSGKVEGDTVTLNQSSMTAAFENATVGENKTVTVSGLALDNNDNNNYKLPNTINTTANITKANGVGSVKLDGWTYGDEANSPEATSTTNGTDNVTYQYKVKGAEDNTYSTTVPTNAGEYTVKATFPASDNYNETTATADFTISPKELTVKVTAKNKTYDGTQNVTLNTPTLVGVEAADTGNVTLDDTNVKVVFNNKDVGTDKPVVFSGEYKLSGTAAKNYTVAMPTGIKATITPATLTISGATVTAKTYDGSGSATVTGVTFEGVKEGDTLTLNTDYTVYNAKYDGVNATGDGAATKASFNVVLNSNDTTKNYVLNTTAGTQTPATIGKASRDNSTLKTKGNRGEENTLSDLSGYVVDGGTVGDNITVSDTNGILDGTPSYDSATGKLTYKLKDSAANDQTATVTLPVTSANYNDYSIVVTVGVTPKETVEIGIDGKDFEYNGTAQAPTGITVAGNKVLVSALEVTYEGTDGTTYEKSTTAPTNAGKYIMTVKVPDSNTKYSGSQTCAFEITKKALTATIKAENKTYDGTTEATVTPTLTGVVAGDSGKVTANVTNPAFADKNVGEKKVTAAITLSGTAAGNYTVNATAETTATISVREVSIVNVTVESSKTYDKTATAATITNNSSISGKVSTDSLEITAGTASYNNANVGENKTVSFTGFALTGTDAGNYKLKGQPASTTAAITAKEVTISGVVIETTKVYDGNTTAKITSSGTLTGVETGDTVTIKAGTATYNDRTANDSKTVTFSGFELEGADADNYKLKEQPTETSAAITQREVTISGLSATKTYDGDTTAEKTEISGTPVVGNKAVATDDVTLNTTSMTGTFDSENVKDAKTVTISGISLTGADYANYKLPETVTCTGTITKADGSGSVTLDGWTYGETAKTPQPTSDTNGTDHVTYRYKLKDAADTEYSATVPTNAGTYTVEATFAETNNYNAVVTTGEFAIAQKTLSMTAEAQDKTYDGNATATVNTTLDTTGVVGNDTVTLVTTGVTASFNTKDAGENKTVTLTGEYKLTGDDASNYTLTQPTGLAAEIKKKALTVNVAVASKTYDGTNTATISGTPTLVGVVEGETVTLENGTPTFNSVNVGEGITISFTDFSISGTDASNYTLTQPSGITASINAYNATGNEYTTTTKDWTNQNFVVTAASGWKVSETNTDDGTWSDTLTRSAETGDTSGSLRFYVKNTDSGVISEVITETYKIDKTAPTGMIKIDERSKWQEFVNTITFNLFYKEKQSVTLTSNDAGSGVKTIEYLVTEEDLNTTQLADRTFTTYANAFGIEPDAKLIIYAKLTDNAGNVTYLRSDGVVLDATAPAINGAENGKTYCAAVTLTITDDYLDTVTLNNETVTLTADGTLTLNPAEGTQTVVATDKAGNSTSITVTVNSDHTWGDWVSNGDNTHTRTCRYNAAHTETGECHGGTATCKDKAVCEDCGGAHGELAPHNHANLKHVEAKTATTAAEGNIEYWYCDGCGKYYKDADATEEITKDDTVRAKLAVKSKPAKTGDESSVTLWLVLTLLSGAGVGATTVLGKRKRYGK